MPTSPATDAWLPTSDHLEHSGVSQLVRSLGLADFDALCRFALAEPAAYWAGVARHCQFVWDEPPAAYVDLSRGPQFPAWFPGARLNFVNSVLAWGERDGGADRLAVVEEHEDGRVESLTFSALRDRIAACARVLLGHGAAPGDRVGLLMENGIHATVSMLAIVAIGAVAVPLFSGFGVDAVVARLSAAGARLFIASPRFQRRGKPVMLEPVVRSAWAELPALQQVLWTSLPEGATDSAREAVLGDEMRALAPVSFTPRSCGANDPFLLIYTSGTTGKPKGIVHTHGGFPLKIAHDALVHFDLAPGDVFCWPADMGWIAGSLVLASALLRGATLVCYSGGPDYPDYSRFSRLIARHRITYFGSAPTLIRGMASNSHQATQGDVSSIKLLVTAGEGIDPEHFCWFQRNFGRGVAPLINYTGGTEASGALLGSVVVKPIVPSGFNSASPGVPVDIVDAGGQSLTDTVGELAVRGPFLGMTQSFWQDDARYLDTYWKALPGVWVHGDLALRHADGQFFMRGRSDDTLKVAGKRLGPAEVEEAVLKLTEISEAAAIGVPDAERGERLVVFVIAAASSSTRAEELERCVMAQVEAQLGRPFRPAAVHCVSQLPKTRSSKTMRRVIRNLYCDNPPGDLSALDNPAALDEIRRVAPARST